MVCFLQMPSLRKRNRSTITMPDLCRNYTSQFPCISSGTSSTIVVVGKQFPMMVCILRDEWTCLWRCFFLAWWLIKHSSIELQAIPCHIQEAIWITTELGYARQKHQLTTSNQCEPHLVHDQIAPLCRRNFSVSTAFTKTEEATESASGGVTFIADHPLLFSVLVKHSARRKWRVAVVPQFLDLMTLLFLQWCSLFREDFCTYKIQDCVCNYVCEWRKVLYTITLERPQWNVETCWFFCACVCINTTHI